MGRKSDEALKRRLEQLFEDAAREARIGVVAVIDEAARLGTLGSSGVGLSVSKVVEESASTALDQALVSLDKAGHRAARAGMVRDAVDTFFRTVADAGKQGPAFPGSRDAIIDKSNREACARMYRRIDVHLGGWNDPKQSWHVRHSFAWEWIKILLGGLVGFVFGLALMWIKTRYP